MSFTVSYELFRGDVLAVAGGKASEPAVLIKCSNSFERLKDGSLFDKNMTFKIPWVDYDFALKISKFIKNKFDNGEMVSFSGSFPRDNLVIVTNSFERFLS